MSHPLCYTNHMMKMKKEENQNGFKSNFHEWLAEMNRRREFNRKRDEEQARWDAQFNAPLNWKDRD